jgi:hypothetical protein
MRLSNLRYSLNNASDPRGLLEKESDIAFELPVQVSAGKVSA